MAVGAEKQKDMIVKICAGLLETGEVDTVIGYTAGVAECMRIPYIFSDPADAQNLEWDQGCSPNLCGYLHGRKDRVGIVAKPCDVRGIVNYLVEKQIMRDRVYIIGVDCIGMNDAHGEATPWCSNCTVKVPPIFDVRVKKMDIVDGTSSKCDSDGTSNGGSAGNDADTGNADETKDCGAGGGLSGNLEKFQNEIKKCILCYSCRQECYGCYCSVCFMDRSEPNWLPSAPDAGTKMVYHLGRAMHLSGRCVECGACERVCASGVDVRYIIRNVTGFIEEVFGYRTGLDTEAKPAMADFSADDPEIGFFGGDGE